MKICAFFTVTILITFIGAFCEAYLKITSPKFYFVFGVVVCLIWDQLLK